MLDDAEEKYVTAGSITGYNFFINPRLHSYSDCFGFILR